MSDLEVTLSWGSLSSIRVKRLSADQMLKLVQSPKLLSLFEAGCMDLPVSEECVTKSSELLGTLDLEEKIHQRLLALGSRLYPQ